jgi:hypothetical protein
VLPDFGDALIAGTGSWQLPPPPPVPDWPDVTGNTEVAETTTEEPMIVEITGVITWKVQSNRTVV